MLDMKYKKKHPDPQGFEKFADRSATIWYR